MQSAAITVDEYLASLPDDRREAISAVRDVVNANLEEPHGDLSDGLYSAEPEVEWFREQYAERGIKLDLGKSCVRFKNLEQVPLDVIGEVIVKVPPKLFIERYESARR